VGGKIERDLSAEQLRERLSAELRRYMAPVVLPTGVPREEDESDANMESPLRARAPMSADEDDDPGMERPL